MFREENFLKVDDLCLDINCRKLLKNYIYNYKYLSVMCLLCINI